MQWYVNAATINDQQPSNIAITASSCSSRLATLKVGDISNTGGSWTLKLKTRGCHAEHSREAGSRYFAGQYLTGPARWADEKGSIVKAAAERTARS